MVFFSSIPSIDITYSSSNNSNASNTNNEFYDSGSLGGGAGGF